MSDNKNPQSVCALNTSAVCPKCGSPINFKKMNKDFCNCKKCTWHCDNKCVTQKNKEKVGG